MGTILAIACRATSHHKRHRFLAAYGRRVKDVPLCEKVSRIRQSLGIFARLRGFTLNLLWANGEIHSSLASYDHTLNIDRVFNTQACSGEN